MSDCEGVGGVFSCACVVVRWVSAICRAAGQPLNEMSVLGWSSRFMNSKSIAEYTAHLREFHGNKVYVLALRFRSLLFF